MTWLATAAPGAGEEVHVDVVDDLHALWSEVQAQDPEERQPREARVYLVPQGVSRPFRPTRPLEPSPEPGFPCLNSRAHMRVSAIILPSNQSCEAGGCSVIL